MRVGQIGDYTRWLEQRLGATVQGMWVPERVWEQAIASDIADAGIKYTVLDDFHFKNAGLNEDELNGYFVTEDDGRTLNVFPGSERLRYLIPFGAPHETIDYLRGIAERHPGAPGILFGIGCDHLLERMYAAGPQVIGLDWRTPIGDARRRLGPDTVVQGNLDPALVLAGTEPALAGTRAVLHDNGGHPGHIFNLGHGVQPDTDPGVLKAIVDLVHETTQR